MLADNIRTNTKEIRDILFSSGGRAIALIIGFIVIEMLIFHAGVVVGSHRHFREREDHRFGFRPVPGMSEVHMPRGFIQDGHGTVGTVESVGPSTLVVRMRDGSSQTVLLSGTTAIRGQSGDMDSDSIVSGEQIIVLGVPNDDGTISSDMIRVVQNNLSRNTQYQK